MRKMLNRFRSILTWSLIAVMLCAVLLPGFAAAEAAAEETEEVASEDYAILARLLNTYQVNPTTDTALEEPDGVSAYCVQLYYYINPDQEKVYYGGPEEATELLKNVFAALFQDEGYTDTGLFLADYYYVYVWSILHANISENYKARPMVNEIMKEVFRQETSDIFAAATDVCFDYIALYEPELAATGYNMNTNPTTIEGSDEYIQAYTEGVQLFENGKYQEAIEAYTRALSYNESDTLAHFEIAEAYIALRDFGQAREWLTKVIPNIKTDGEKARLLRRLGFIAIEEMNYEAAAALYTYSLQFEESSMVTDELGYIQYIAPGTRTFTEADAQEYVISECGIAFGE